MIDYKLVLDIVDRETGKVLLRRSRSHTIQSFDGVNDRAIFDTLSDQVRDELVPGGSTVVELEAIGFKSTVDVVDE